MAPSVLTRRKGWRASSCAPGSSRSRWFLTHGHFDHIWDSYLIQEDHQCPVWVHSADAPMVLDTSYIKMFGITPAHFARPPAWNISRFPTGAARLFSARARSSRSSTFRAIRRAAWRFIIPAGACSSAATPFSAAGSAAGICPGGSRTALLQGLQKYLVPLPPETRVYAGHGPSHDHRPRAARPIPTWKCFRPGHSQDRAGPIGLAT